MIGKALAKVFGTKNEREVKRLMPMVARINSFEPEIEKLTDAELRAKTQEFRQRLLNVGLEPLLNTPEDFAKIIAADSAQWNGIMPGLNLKQQ